MRPSQVERAVIRYARAQDAPVEVQPDQWLAAREERRAARRDLVAIGRRLAARLTSEDEERETRPR